MTRTNTTSSSAIADRPRWWVG